MNKKIEIEIPEGKVAEWKEINGVTTLILTEEKDNRPVTERIKTFEDACNELGDEHPLVKEYWGVININLDIKQDLISYLKLRIIIEALNEGWKPKLDVKEYRYAPYFYTYTQEEVDEMDEDEKASLLYVGSCANNSSICGLSASDADCALSRSDASFGSRLTLKSLELAIYCGNQFREIWFDFIFK